MTTPDRRSLLRGAGAAALAASLPGSINRALAAPGNHATGTIQDVRHIVILMQENRSFDHYFGTLRGVRGFADPRAVTLPSGKSVFYQPTADGTGVILPFHPPGAGVGMQFLEGTDHNWSDAHGAWNNGNNDQWLKAKKKAATMSYLKRSDIPFHYALADAFTICDAYHCSTMTSTDPNRYYLWSGWLGQNGSSPDGLNVGNAGSTPGNVNLNASGPSAGNGQLPFGPVVNNDEQGYSWTTYPERLQHAGISWKIYQDVGLGLTAAGYWGWTSNPYIGNYGDTSTLYFLQYQNATPGNPLYELSCTGTNIYNGGAFNGGSLFDALRQDVQANRLPQVSWIVAPEAYCEHPNWPANYGAWYVANILAALTANPEVWSRTALIYCFDENDGLFDHVVAPTAPQSAAQGKSTVSTVNEIYPGTSNPSYPAFPYGLGARVPMLIISPWSKGGWVCSQVFDHTSIIRFIEQRFGVIEPNISPWRRAVCGDLTSAFDFSRPDPELPQLPRTSAYAAPRADIVSGKRYPDVTLTPPAQQSMPVQEPGRRLARALPYELQADFHAHPSSQSFDLTFTNTGKAGAWFHVRSANGASAGDSTGPWGYTVEAGKSLSDTWTPPGSQAYAVAVYGPNGFFRSFAGNLHGAGASLAVASLYDLENGGISLIVSNRGLAPARVSIVDNYTGNARQVFVPAGGKVETYWPLRSSHRWYDLTVTASADPGFSHHYAGHVETGADGVSDPHL